MITGGIDLGFEYIKAVVVKDGAIIGKAVGCSGGAKRCENAEHVWNEALKNAGIAAEAVERLAATGKGKFDVPFASMTSTEPSCIAEAAKAFDAGVTTAMNIGADEMIVVTIREDGKIEQMLLNQKCSAGCGLMLEVLANRLSMTMEQFGMLDMEKAVDTVVSDGCMPFAELDALSLLNHGVAPEAIAGAAIKSAAVRGAVVYDDITLHRDAHVLLTGGVALLSTYVAELKKRTGIDFIVPKNAAYATAFGAALRAAKNV